MTAPLNFDQWEERIAYDFVTVPRQFDVVGNVYKPKAGNKS